MFVCLALREKVLKLDAKTREYDIVVIGEEPHLAYNRVGLTTFFEHRNIENLYLNSEDWVGVPFRAMIAMLELLTRLCSTMVLQTVLSAATSTQRSLRFFPQQK